MIFTLKNLLIKGNGAGAKTTESSKNFEICQKLCIVEIFSNFSDSICWIYQQSTYVLK